MPKKPVTKKIKKKIKPDIYQGKYVHVLNKRWTENEIKSLADELLHWVEAEPKNLWFNDFFIEKRITRRRISDTFMKNDYFVEVYDLCKGIQESRMFKAGTSKQTNPAMFIIGLKNNHGWKDRQDISMEGESKVLQVKFV